MSLDSFGVSIDCCANKHHCVPNSFRIHAWIPVFHDDALSLTGWQCVPRLRRAVTVEGDRAVFRDYADRDLGRLVFNATQISGDDADHHLFSFFSGLPTGTKIFKGV